MFNCKRTDKSFLHYINIYFLFIIFFRTFAIFFCQILEQLLFWNVFVIFWSCNLNSWFALNGILMKFFFFNDKNKNLRLEKTFWMTICRQDLCIEMRLENCRWSINYYTAVKNIKIHFLLASLVNFLKIYWKLPKWTVLIWDSHSPAWTSLNSLSTLTCTNTFINTN